MPSLNINNSTVHYQLSGEGESLVLIHGAFVSLSMWKPQMEYFSQYFRVVTYDIRGHGKTGSTPLKKYTIAQYAHDLLMLMDALEINNPIVCGLSLGGMIAQVYATKYPSRLSALILCDTAASLTITTWDKMMRLMYPKWLMLLSIRLMGVTNFIKFSFWTAEKTRSMEWLGDGSIIEYEKNEMKKISKSEYLKIFGSLYDFSLQPLEKIKVPTLILNGKFEAKSIFKHAEKMQGLIDSCEVDIIDNAGHVSNMENIDEFNQKVINFLQKYSIITNYSR
ncbi:MAG: alpha/beta hydrolase [Candidatus Heimdallarchaeota archaeon]|nr:alpha/beta hydrolase [Candidatus Heimdallarchaeota archaeon]